jgi:hypothetical protein
MHRQRTSSIALLGMSIKARGTLLQGRRLALPATTEQQTQCSMYGCSNTL